MDGNLKVEIQRWEFKEFTLWMGIKSGRSKGGNLRNSTYGWELVGRGGDPQVRLRWRKTHGWELEGGTLWMGI